MKKVLIILMAFVLVGCSNNTVVTNAPNATNENNLVVVEDSVVDHELDLEEVANEFLVDFSNKDTQALLGEYNYTPAMLDFMTEKNLTDTYASLNLGSIVKTYPIVETAKDEYIIITTPTEFEHASFDFNVVFQDGLVAGFNVKAFSGIAVDHDDLIAIAEEHHMLFSKDDFDSMIELDYTDKMKNVITADMYKSAKADMNVGELIEVKDGYIVEVQGFQIVNIPVIYEHIEFNYNVVFQGNLIAGFNVGEFSEKGNDELPEGVIETPLMATVNNQELDGILTVPEGEGPFKCVVLVHGSGSSDKDETILVNKPFRDIAWQLAQQGIATYRYDKGSYANPERFVNQYDFTLMDETVNDAVDIVTMIQSNQAIEGVYVLGHSLGGHSIPLIAQNSSADGYIIMAGNVSGLDVLIKEQVEYLANLDGQVTSEEEARLLEYTLELDKLSNLSEVSEDEIIFGAYKAYWQFLNDYAPLEEAAKIKEEVLVLQGKRDYQVTLEEYNLWLTLEDQGNWTYRVYDDLNHLMIAGQGPANNDEYGVAGHVADQVISDIVEWINK